MSECRRVAAIGECMIELTEAGEGAGDGGGEGTMRRGFGGDTLNTAVYMARLGAAAGIAVDYVSALGDDPYSDALVAAWEAEGIGTRLVARLPGRLPGLYAIRNEPNGERSFWYWRSASAARDMLAEPHGEAALTALKAYELIYVSGITLSILEEDARERLLEGLSAARVAGARIAVDTNWRPRNWPDPGAGRLWTTKLYRLADIALPSLDDQAGLFGDSHPAIAAERLLNLGVREVVVKDGARPSFIAGHGLRDWVAAEVVDRPVDTTAAGDSFNAAYLTARLAGRSQIAAAEAGHRLAATVVRHRGAILPADAMPVLDMLDPERRTDAGA